MKKRIGISIFLGILLTLSWSLPKNQEIQGKGMEEEQKTLAESILLYEQDKTLLEEHLASLPAEEAGDLSIRATLEATIRKALENLEVDMAKARTALKAVTSQILSTGTGMSLPAMGDGTFTWPVEGYLNVSQGYRKGHPAVDINTMGASPRVFAVQSGVVVRVAEVDGYGKQVVLDHGNGIQTQYAHLQEIHVEQGDYLKEGETLGLVGDTGWSDGKHLHFQITITGDLADRSIDPMKFLR